MGPARSCVPSGAGLSAVVMGWQEKGQAGRTNCALRTRNVFFVTRCGDSRVCFTAELLELHCFLSCLHLPFHAKTNNQNETIPLPDNPERTLDFQYISQNIAYLHFPHRILSKLN